MTLWYIEQRYKDAAWEPHEDYDPTERESLARARYALIVEEQSDWVARNGPGLQKDYRLLRCEVIATTEDA